MKLERRKVVTLKRVGIVVVVIFIFYIATWNILKDENFNRYAFFNKIPGIIFDKSSQKMTFYRQANETWSTARANLRGTNLVNKTTVPKIVSSIRKNLNSSLSVSPSSSSLSSMANKSAPKPTNRTKMKPTSRVPSEISLSKILKSSRSLPVTTTQTAPLTTKTRHFICVNLMGRLGNLMFEYASAYGIARSKGMDVIISENALVAKVFRLDRGGRVVKDTSMCRGLRTVSEARASAFDNQTIKFGNDKNVALFGYLQSFKYFEKFSDEIRRQFTFRDPIKRRAEQAILDIFREHLKKARNISARWTFVAIHVRRGDMVNNKHGYMVAPKEYFYRAQKIFRVLYINVIFIVCSDDIGWSKNNLKFENTYFVTGNSPEVDMAILSSCNHTISSVGSFSWWSSWLSKGIVTYYSPPAKPGSSLRTQYSKDFNDYFPSAWIRIEL